MNTLLEKAPSRCLKFLEPRFHDAFGLLEENDQPQNQEQTESEKPKKRLEPIPITSFYDLVSVFQEVLYFTESMVQALAVCLATNISVRIAGELIWLYLHGPASSGKSTICEAISADLNSAEAISKFTGVHSGYKSGKKGKKKDVSLLHAVNGKTMIIKDWTSVLSMPPTMLENIYGELRDVYDGSSKTHYRHGVNNNYKNIVFSIIAGVTDEILRHNHAHLGERFIMVDLSDDSHGSRKHVRSALVNINAALLNSFPKRRQPTADGAPNKIPPDRMERVKRATIGFLDHLHEQITHCDPPHVSDDAILRISEMARFIARVRGRVVRDKDVIYKPRAEVAIRLSSQLLKLGVCLCVVFNKKELDDDIMDLVGKVASDTIRGFNFDIVASLMQAHGEGKLGLDKHQIAAKVMCIKPTTVESRLDDLRILKVVSRVELPNQVGVRGRHRHLWQVLPTVQKLWPYLVGSENPS